MKKVVRAIKQVARGTSLRQAALQYDAPFSSLRDHWIAMGGQANSDNWQAFVLSAEACDVPQQAEVPAPDVPAQSPLGPRLRRLCTRYGDAIAYGQHGEWGMCREGCKEMTTKIDEGKLTACAAAELLSAEGVYISETVLERKARWVPGQSPVKAGSTQWIPDSIEEDIHAEVKKLRMHDIPVFKDFIMGMANQMIVGTPAAEKFPGGEVNDTWYYTFLDRKDMSTDILKPLEIDRDAWLTSKVMQTRK